MKRILRPRVVHPRSLLASLAPIAFGVAASVSACAPASSGPSATSATREGPPLVLDFDELVKHVTPRDGEEAVLVNFWATWCPPCVKEMPELAKLHEEWQGKGVRIEAVALDLEMPQRVKTAEGIGKFADRKGFDLPIVAFQGDAQSLMRTYGLGGSIPYTVVLDADGNIAERLTGMGNRKRFEQMIESARKR